MHFGPSLPKHALLFAAFLAACSGLPSQPALSLAAPTTKPAYINPGAQHDELVAGLQSGDGARAAAALASIRAYLDRYGGPRHPAGTARAMRIFLDARRFSDLDSIALAEIFKYPADTAGVATMEKLRAQAFLASGDSAKALSTAKAYYDVAPLKETADTIDIVSLCLAAAHRDDPATVQRFKDQQLAWANADPSTQPSQTPADPSLGDPILAQIQPDSKPFDAAIAGIDLNEYAQYIAKGNLLLLAGRAAEARDVFKQAVPIAPAAKAGEAAESVARAIRPQSGCVAPANAYILSLQGAK